MPDKTLKRRKFIINVAYWAIILAIVFICFKYALPLLMPFLLALFCSFLIRPLITFFNKKCHFGKNFASLISLFILFVFILGIVFLVVLRIVNWVIDGVEVLPSLYSNTIEPALQNTLSRLDTASTNFDPALQQLVNSLSPQILSSAGSAVSGIATSVLGWVSSLATKLPSFLIAGVMFLIGTIFITLGYDSISAFLKRNLPKSAVSSISAIKKHFFIIIFQYGKGYFLIMLITFAEILIGLLIAGVGSPVLLAVLIAVFDIFPIVGAGTILIPWAVIDFIIGKTSLGISLLILYAVEISIRQIIEPKIIGKHVGLNPVVTLMSMYVGSRLFGGLGLFGLPISMAILKNLNITGTFHFLKYDDDEISSEAASAESASSAAAEVPVQEAAPPAADTPQAGTEAPEDEQ